MLTNGKIYSSMTSLNKLLEQVLTSKIEPRVPYILKENALKIEPLFKVIDEQRSSIILKYCKKDETGQPLKPKDETGKEMQDQVIIEDTQSLSRELESLMSLENADIVLTKIKISDLNSLQVEGKVIFDLDWLIDE